LRLNLITAYLDSPTDSPNGIFSDVDNVKIDDGDAQLPAPAQQPEGDLCLVSGADKASLTQKVSLFLSYVTVGVLIFYHSLFSSPHHHLQSLQPRVPSAPPFVDSVTIIISTPIDFSINSQAPIFKIPIPEYPC